MICNKKNCTGCFACYNICPKDAIYMSEAEMGNIYPKIDKKKCIDCGLCKKVCPSLNKVKFTFPKKCYASYSKDKKINKTSSSGGIAYELYKYVLENNGVAYGVSSYLNNNEITFERITSKSHLHRFQGSKYVHAYINNIFRQVKEDLKNKKLVLFIGTPCQVSGLKLYLKKDYDNLILIDLICHGVPPQKLLKEDINRDFDYVNFRGEKDFILVAKKHKKVIYNKSKYNSPYFYSFMNSSIYRESCYNCKYARNERISDLTIGDFWGLKDNKIKNNKNSVILINTKKGNEFINKISNIVLFEEDINMAFNGNGQLNHPSIKSGKFYSIKKNYKKYGLKKCVNKSLTIEDKITILIGNIKEFIKYAILK